MLAYIVKTLDFWCELLRQNAIHKGNGAATQSCRKYIVDGGETAQGRSWKTRKKVLNLIGSGIPTGTLTVKSQFDL